MKGKPLSYEENNLSQESKMITHALHPSFPNFHLEIYLDTREDMISRRTPNIVEVGKRIWPPRFDFKSNIVHPVIFTTMRKSTSGGKWSPLFQVDLGGQTQPRRRGTRRLDVIFVDRVLQRRPYVGVDDQGPVFPACQIDDGHASENDQPRLFTYTRGHLTGGKGSRRDEPVLACK